MEEELLSEKHFKSKPEPSIFQTPKKNKEKLGFDLENSASKRRTTYNKSYQQSYLFESMEKSEHMKNDSES